MCLLAALGGCTTEDPTTTTNIPTIPTNPTVDNFSGSVPVQGQDFKPFTITLSGGTLTVALTSTSLPVVVGVGVGAWDGATCTLFPNGSRNVSASAAPQLTFNQVTGGPYCISVFDVGNDTTALGYTMTLTHY